MPEYKLMMLTNASPGRDADLLKWYEGHLGDMLRIPGVTGAQCFDHLQDISVAPPAAALFKYLAVYDISTEDLGHTLTTLQSAVMSGEMAMSDALDPNTSAIVYRARGAHKGK
jgi:hypothetical protein